MLTSFNPKFSVQFNTKAQALNELMAKQENQLKVWCQYVTLILYKGCKPHKHHIYSNSLMPC